MEERQGKRRSQRGFSLQMGSGQGILAKKGLKFGSGKQAEGVQIQLNLAVYIEKKVVVGNISASWARNH